MLRDIPLNRRYHGDRSRVIVCLTDTIIVWAISSGHDRLHCRFKPRAASVNICRLYPWLQI